MDARRTPSFKLFLTAVMLLLLAPASAQGARRLHAGQTLARHSPRRHHGARHHAARSDSTAPRYIASRPAGLVLLGEEQIRDSVTALNPGEAEAFQFRARSSGITQSAHVYLGWRNSATTLVTGLYSSLAGKPGALITTGTLSATQGGAWNTVPLAPQQLLAGNTYWLAVLGAGGQLRIRDRHEGSCSAAGSALRSGALSGAWSTSTIARTCPVSGYVTGTASEPKLEEPVAEQPPVTPPPVAEPPVSEPPAKEPPAKEPPAKEPPKEAPPAAPANTAAPSIAGTAQEGRTLTAGPGSWTGSPTSFAYQWQDCDALGASCTSVAGATASSLTLGSADAGHTVRVVVTATNAGGSTAASSAQSAVVASLPPLPPVNTSAPVLSGSAVEAQTLSTSNGTWTGSPTSFAYQWQDCSVLGLLCSNIAGATSPSYKLRASDVGHTLRAQVTATNDGGSLAAVSAASATVTEAPAATGCFANPESCGYPGTADTGANCSSLTPSGSVTASTPGQKVENLNITGTLTVNAAKVTVNNVCVTTNGGARLGSSAVFLSKGATETTITNSTIRGENETSRSVEEALSNNYGNAGATASKVQLYNCGECLHQTWTLTRSYVNVNGMKGTSDHYEDWYYSDATIVAGEDTLLNPQEQTAVLFGDTHVGGGGPCDNHLTVTGSLIGGGGALFYPCGNASSAGSSTMTIENNRFARCTGAHQYEPESGGTLCAGGADSHGYYPYGGFFMTAAYIYSGAGQVWQNNVWDDNNEVASP